MDVLEKYLHDISYKFPKGYPDMNNPKDVELLRSLINEIVETTTQVINEGSEEAIYDTTIRKALDLKEDEPIPQSKGSYPFQSSTFEINVASSDMSTFNKLYNVAPPKKGETEGETKGVGNGEIALYWLYNYNENKSINVTVGREGDDPDLRFNDKGVEVKSYTGGHNKLIQLGRFGNDRENLSLLSIIFGIKALNKVIGGKDLGPSVNPTNFKGKDLIPAFEMVLDLEKIEDLDNLANKYNIFQTIKDNLNTLRTQLNDPDSAEDAAKEMALRILKWKLGNKPGNGGYLANVLPKGNIKFWYVDFEKLLSTDTLLNDFGISQSSIKVHFNNMFG